MKNRLPRALLCLLLALPPASLSSGEAAPGPPFLLPDGQGRPQPRQLGLDEIDELPTRKENCPSCGFAVAVPEPDKLLRGAAPDAWTMHAASRDSDLCPYPEKGKVDFQADIVVCPFCGYAAKTGDFSPPLPPELRGWVNTALKPVVREAELRLLGRRAGDFPESVVVEFFNRQQDIPDRLRCELARSAYAAKRAPAPVRAEMAWRSAWACRRALVLPPSGDFLRERTATFCSRIAKTVRPPGGAEEWHAVLQSQADRIRAGKSRLDAAEQYAVAMLLAGAYARLGLQDAAGAELARLAEDARTRFARPEQDPLWRFTAVRAAKNGRQALLEKYRAEMEREIAERAALAAAEREYLAEAAGFLKDAILAGDFAAPDEALRHAYLAADFQRRQGELSLASEWFKAVAALAPRGSELAGAAERQLAVVARQAGDSVNLLAGIGHDGEFLEKLREICTN